MYYICFKKNRKKGDILRKNIYIVLYLYKLFFYEKSDKFFGWYLLDWCIIMFGFLLKFLIL